MGKSYAIRKADADLISLALITGSRREQHARVKNRMMALATNLQLGKNFQVRFSDSSPNQVAIEPLQQDPPNTDIAR